MAISSIFDPDDFKTERHKPMGEMVAPCRGCHGVCSDFTWRHYPTYWIRIEHYQVGHRDRYITSAQQS